jgi:AMMECR1 domain-containing protein
LPVLFEKKGRIALFLPQVWEELPEKKLFLEQLSMKAYMKPSDYKTADYKKFKVQCFK